MSETTEAQPTNPATTKPTVSFSIWPPSQRTRDAVTKRLIETLSSPSVLSKRYGTVPEEEAGVIASKIEGEAFETASGSAGPDDDGIEILQGYSKEISKRMLETVKARSAGSDAQAQAGSGVTEGAEGVDANAEAN
ncbi:MFP1 attachment factor 1 [Heracleum sosnowskyi]|uniref:MFP1 attachment factor 1 n=1 Tax=Heracleum sosnowskyi TaxID=360622 RepID=A0AAD8IUH5_9APIA|nr:MFP1 attachment factor 1 [Heracleum sosnowskyi]